MNNALCLSRKINKILNSSCKKNNIKDWSYSKSVKYSEHRVKIDLSSIVKYQGAKISYATDEIAKITKNFNFTLK